MVEIQKEAEEILQTCSKCLYNVKLLQTQMTLKCVGRVYSKKEPDYYIILYN